MEKPGKQKWLCRNSTLSTHEEHFRSTSLMSSLKGWADGRTDTHACGGQFPAVGPPRCGSPRLEPRTPLTEWQTRGLSSYQKQQPYQDAHLAFPQETKLFHKMTCRCFEQQSSHFSSVENILNWNTLTSPLACLLCFELFGSFSFNELLRGKNGFLLQTPQDEFSAGCPKLSSPGCCLHSVQV